MDTKSKDLSFSTSAPVGRAAATWLQADLAVKDAERTRDAARAKLLTAVDKAYPGQTTVAIDAFGQVVRVQQRERRSFDVDILKAGVSNPVFRSVTCVKVLAELWDAAMANGKIPEDVAKEAITVTPVTEIRVGR